VPGHGEPRKKKKRMREKEGGGIDKNFLVCSAAVSGTVRFITGKLKANSAGETGTGKLKVQGESDKRGQGVKESYLACEAELVGFKRR